MNDVVYAIRSRKTGLYYSREINTRSGECVWRELMYAVLYKTEEGAQRMIDGASTEFVRKHLHNGDPFIVPVKLVDMYTLPTRDITNMF